MTRPEELTIDHEGYDWPRLLEPWQDMLPANFTVRLMSRLGDLFLEFGDGSIHLFSAGDDAVTFLAEDWDAFRDAIGDNPDWLMGDVIWQYEQAGKRLAPGQVYSLTPPPFLSGDYGVERALPLDVRTHFAVLGDIHAQTRDLPDGAQLKLVIKDPPWTSPLTRLLGPIRKFWKR